MSLLPLPLFSPAKLAPSSLPAHAKPIMIALRAAVVSTLASVPVPSSPCNAMVGVALVQHPMITLPKSLVLLAVLHQLLTELLLHPPLRSTLLHLLEGPEHSSLLERAMAMAIALRDAVGLTLGSVPVPSSRFSVMEDAAAVRPPMTMLPRNSASLVELHQLRTELPPLLSLLLPHPLHLLAEPAHSSSPDLALAMATARADAADSALASVPVLSSPCSATEDVGLEQARPTTTQQRSLGSPVELLPSALSSGWPSPGLNRLGGQVVIF